MSWTTNISWSAASIIVWELLLSIGESMRLLAAERRREAGSDLEYSCLGDRRGVTLWVCAGLFSMLCGFFFSVELGIQVNINVDPNIYSFTKQHLILCTKEDTGEIDKYPP